MPTSRYYSLATDNVKIFYLFNLQVILIRKEKFLAHNQMKIHILTQPMEHATYAYGKSNSYGIIELITVSHNELLSHIVIGAMKLGTA